MPLLILSRVLRANHATVASENPLASLAGYETMRSGGNAFDAAVATSFALAVTMHHIGGLGGDFFGMFYEAKTGKAHCLNSSGWAPSGLTVEAIRSRGEDKVPTYGPLSCVVPGQVAGVAAMHKKFGVSEWKTLLRPAKDYALGGFPASEGLCRAVAGVFESLSPDAMEVFAPDGRPPLPGSTIKQMKLGMLVDELAVEGAEAFYEGTPAEEMRERFEALGVPAQPGDFRDFAAEWVEPLILEYRGTVVHEVPPNSMGATCLLMLKILEGQDFSKAGPLSRERIGTTMEAAETAYDRRDRMLCDPRFHRIDMDEFMKPSRPQRPYSGRVAEGDTTAFSVADKEGNIVSAIQSLFRHFGSHIFVPGCGIMINDRGAGFRLEGPNRVEPRKRPLHTLSSLILKRGDSVTAIGTSGGDYRPIQHSLLVTNIVDYKMSLEQAVDHPRFLWSEGRSLMVESGYQDYVTSRFDLQKLSMPDRTGVCQAIDVRGSTQTAVCDVRGEGVPAGF
jgi:gamma-glutamyltranspeptidase/glutathione hydrolase